MLNDIEINNTPAWKSPQGLAARALRDRLKESKSMSDEGILRLIRRFDKDFEHKAKPNVVVYDNIVKVIATKRALFEDPWTPEGPSDAGSGLSTARLSTSSESVMADGTSTTSSAIESTRAAEVAADITAAMEPEEEKEYHGGSGVEPSVMGDDVSTDPPSGPTSIRGGGGGGAAVAAGEEVAEEVVLTAATNMAGDDKSNEKAAGDSGLGNGMKFDFITGTGRGKPGQVIQRGDQRALYKEKKRIEDADEKAADGKNNTVGLNLTKPEEFAALQPQSGGDKILDPVVLDTGRASLRPQFLLGGEDAVRKTGRERMEMDVQFDMFDYVPDGFGLGAHNKMFVQEKNHERLIRYREPLYAPRREDGSEYIAVAFDERLEAAMKPSGVTNWMKRTGGEMASLGSAIKKQKVASVDTLADDNNVQRSSKGLRGRKPSPFETVINTKSPWIPTVEPAGVFMKRQLKSVFNTQRTPQANVEQNPNNGGPTLSRKEAMAIILP